MHQFCAKISTNGGPGDAILYLRKDDQQGTILFQITENEEGCRGLVPGQTYWVEFHFWCSGPATYAMELTGPECPPFPANHTYNYTKAHDTTGAFSFTA